MQLTPITRRLYSGKPVDALDPADSHLALRKLAVVPMTKEEAMAMRGFWKNRPLDDTIVPDDDGPSPLANRC